MREKIWKIEFIPEATFSIDDGKVTNYENGYYIITSEGHKYGSIGKAAFDDMKTGEILGFIENMMNDAHDLALKLHD